MTSPATREYKAKDNVLWRRRRALQICRAELGNRIAEIDMGLEPDIVVGQLPIRPHYRRLLEFACDVCREISDELPEPPVGRKRHG